MNSEDHSRAIVEFERFIHFFPDDSQVPKARYLIGICYLNSRQHEAARKVFTEIVASKPASPFAGNALLLIGESYYKQGVFKEAARYFSQVVETYPDSDLKNVALYRLGWTTMNVNRWEEASDIFSDVQEESLYFESAQQLAAESLKGKDLPQKNPTTAGALAAILPGLGHAYVSRYRDATIAFLVNGLFIWGAVQSFRHDQYVVGGMLTFLEIGWYSGNIYSAVNVAHKHNRKVQNDFRGRLKDRLDLKLFTAIGGRIGLALTLKF
jgi:TolA-binding protein